MIVQGTSVGLDVHALSVVAHAVDEETGQDHAGTVVPGSRRCPGLVADVAEYLIDARESYCANLIAAGVPTSVATRTSDETFSQSFPGGRPAAGHQVFRVEHGGEKAGLLWIGPQSTTEPERWWVFDIVITRAFRGQGLGRQAMLLAEKEARAQGSVELGLNVFGHNTVAVALYQSLGYEMTSMRMRKPLS